MKFCQQCGTELPANAGFCPQCGYRVAPAPAEEEPLQFPASEEHKGPSEPILPESPSPESKEPDLVGGPPPPLHYAAPPPPPQQAVPPFPYGAPSQAPPPYYGAPQAPHPAQPYPPYAYGIPPAAPKRKSRWYIPVIIIVVFLGLLAAAWFVFGDQIRNLFVSPEKRWAQADQASKLIPEDSLLAPLKETMKETVEKNRFGSKIDLTFDIKADDLPDEMAEMLTLMSGLRLHLDYKVDMSGDDARYRTRLGLGKRDDAGEALAVEFYNVDESYVISVPGILQKPLVIPQSRMGEMTEGFNMVDLPVNPGDLLGMTGMRDKLTIMTGDQFDKLAADLKAIFSRFAGKPDFVKGETLTIGGVSQTLDYFELTVPSDRFADMAKEILAYLRDNRDLEKLLTGMKQTVPLPGFEDSGEGVYDQFLEAIEDMIDDIEESPDQFEIQAKRRLYVDKKNKPVGEVLTLTKLEEGTPETVTLSNLRVSEGNKHANRFFLEAPDQFSLDFLTTFVLEGDRRTGEFSVKASELNSYNTSPPKEVLKGTFSDFGWEKSGDTIYPVGKISLEFVGLDQLQEDAPENVKLSYQGKVESGRLTAQVELQLIIQDMPFSLTVGINHQNLSGEEVVFKNKMPDDYVDMTDESALMELMEDESVMEAFTEALEKLGIDPDLLGGGFNDDWDDWDDGD
ncbi:MAG TPA: zinc-ribbon domain-containing protein [Bacillota bacterium]|nr:zinc-ribbon domain-containing protein [Fastidiosipila sp.]HPX92647.1 zinc-ribbon domain-containing protein [Bacillota bacterium]HQB81014.1 zinc-ribbon domain-containing protein [Bacillota bacterium]